MSFLASLGASALNLGVSAFNNKLAEKSAEKQYNRQLDFWEKQNAYNSPSNQRALFERAGFNPAAAMGDIAQGSSAQGLSDVPGNEYAQRGVISAEALQNGFKIVGELKKMGSETKNLEAQLKISAIEFLMKNQELFGLQLDNQQKEYLLSRLGEMTDANISKILAEARNLNASADLSKTKQDTEVTQQDVNTATASNINADTTLKQNQAAQAAAQAALITVQTQNYAKECTARINALNASAVASLKQAEQYAANAELLRTQNGIAEFNRIHQENLRTVSDVLGFDIHDLPPTTQIELIRAVDSFNHGLDPVAFEKRISDIIHTANVAATAVIESRSYTGSGSADVIWGLAGASGSRSTSSSRNANKPNKY